MRGRRSCCWGERRCARRSSKRARIRKGNSNIKVSSGRLETRTLEKCPPFPRANRVWQSAKSCQEKPPQAVALQKRGSKTRRYTGAGYMDLEVESMKAATLFLGVVRSSGRKYIMWPAA